MLDPHFVILGAAFSLIGSSRYALLSIRGRVRPNRVTWFLWAVAPIIGFFAQLDDGIGLSSIMTLSVGVGPAIVFVASFVNPASYWLISRFDLACGTLSVAALAVWLSLDDPELVVIFAVLADLAGGLPTLVKAWRAPQTESPAMAFFAVTNGTITLLTLDRWDAASWAFPAYIAGLGITLGSIVMLRGRRLDRPSLVAAPTG